MLQLRNGEAPVFQRCVGETVWRTPSNLINSIHILQPFDIPVFNPLKSTCDARLVKWQRANPRKKLIKKTFFQLLKYVWQEASINDGRTGYKNKRMVRQIGKLIKNVAVMVLIKQLQFYLKNYFWQYSRKKMPRAKETK